MLISQVARKLVASKNPAFLFYHNPNRSIEIFLRRSAWLNEVSTEADRLRLMHSFFVTLSGLQADVASEFDLSGYHYQHPRGWYQTRPKIMLGQGFHSFMMHLLQCFYPTLRSRHFRCTFDAKSVPSFVYGNGRDKSPYLPRLIAHPSKRSITFRANAAWVEHRARDLRDAVGRGNLAIAMSQHPRLGRESKLRQLVGEILRFIVTLID